MQTSDERKLEDLRQGYAQLRLGQTMNEVVAILGPPTSTKPVYSKKDYTKPSGTSIDYKVQTHGLAPNTNDVLILIVFDSGGRLIWAYPQNIPGLSEIGSR